MVSWTVLDVSGLIMHFKDILDGFGEWNSLTQAEFRHYCIWWHHTANGVNVISQCVRIWGRNYYCRDFRNDHLTSILRNWIDFLTFLKCILLLQKKKKKNLKIFLFNFFSFLKLHTKKWIGTLNIKILLTHSCCLCIQISSVVPRLLWTVRVIVRIVGGLDVLREIGGEADSKIFATPSLYGHLGTRSYAMGVVPSPIHWVRRQRVTRQHFVDYVTINAKRVVKRDEHNAL